MSIAEAERLKRELTDKLVIVANGVPELRRFQGLTGRVKTVNMNGRALVQFADREDIAWYDIDPSYLKVVDQPLPPKKRAAEPEAKPTAATKPAPAPAVGKLAPGGKKLSPLELARQQAAGGKTPAAAPDKTAAPAPAGKKLSPLERARMQGAPQPAGAAAPASEAAAPPTAAAESQPVPAAPPPKPAAPATGKKLSPLELARQQDAAKKSDA